jgi:hypothetical protein
MIMASDPSHTFKPSIFHGIAPRAKPVTRRPDFAFYQVAEKVAAHRLLKNVQIQGSSFDKLRINSPEERAPQTAAGRSDEG